MPPTAPHNAVTDTAIDAAIDAAANYIGIYAVEIRDVPRDAAKKAISEIAAMEIRKVHDMSFRVGQLPQPVPRPYDPSDPNDRREWAILLSRKVDAYIHEATRVVEDLRRYIAQEPSGQEVEAGDDCHTQARPHDACSCADYTHTLHGGEQHCPLRGAPSAWCVVCRGCKYCRLLVDGVLGGGPEDPDRLRDLASMMTREIVPIVQQPPQLPPAAGSIEEDCVVSPPAPFTTPVFFRGQWYDAEIDSGGVATFYVEEEDTAHPAPGAEDASLSDDPAPGAEDDPAPFRSAREQYDRGWTTGYTEGRTEGYQDGLKDGASPNPTGEYNEGWRAALRWASDVMQEHGGKPKPSGKMNTRDGQIAAYAFDAGLRHAEAEAEAPPPPSDLASQVSDQSRLAQVADTAIDLHRQAADATAEYHAIYTEIHGHPHPLKASAPPPPPQIGPEVVSRAAIYVRGQWRNAAIDSAGRLTAHVPELADPTIPPAEPAGIQVCDYKGMFGDPCGARMPCIAHDWHRRYEAGRAEDENLPPFAAGYRAGWGDCYGYHTQSHAPTPPAEYLPPVSEIPDQEE